MGGGGGRGADGAGAGGGAGGGGGEGGREEEGRAALEGRGVDLDKGRVAVEDDALCAQVAFDVVRVEPDTAEADRVEDLVDCRLAAREFRLREGERAEGLGGREDVGWVDGRALRVEAREVCAGAAYVKEGHVPILEAFARLALQQLLEAGEHAAAVSEGRR